MVVDRIGNIAKYGNIVKDADALARFFAANPPSSLAAGQRYAVPGAAYTVGPFEMKPQPREERRWEEHRALVDIHITFSGRECLEWKPKEFISDPQEYDDKGDTQFYGDKTPGSFIFVEEGYFVIFEPHDMHKSLVAQGGCAGVKALLKCPAQTK